MENLLANLLPLSKEMNQTLSNGVYAGKRSAYEADSGFKAAGEFAKEYVDWTPTELAVRSEILAKWAINRRDS